MTAREVLGSIRNAGVLVGYILGHLCLYGLVQRISEFLASTAVLRFSDIDVLYRLHIYVQIDDHVHV